jgi:hypothetical protein
MDVRQWREYKLNDKWMSVNGENTNTTTNGWPSMARIQTQRCVCILAIDGHPFVVEFVFSPLTDI